MKKIILLIAIAFAAMGCEYPDDEQFFSEKGVPEKSQLNFRAKSTCFKSSNTDYVGFGSADVSIQVNDQECSPEDFKELVVYYGDDEGNLNMFGPADADTNGTNGITAKLYNLRPGTEYFFKLTGKHKYTETVCTSSIFSLTTLPLEIEITKRQNISSKIITITGTFNNTSDCECEIYCHAALKEHFIGNKYYDHTTECTETDDGEFSAMFENIDNSQKYYFVVEIVANGNSFKSDVFYK